MDNFVGKRLSSSFYRGIYFSYEYVYMLGYDVI